MYELNPGVISPYFHIPRTFDSSFVSHGRAFEDLWPSLKRWKRLEKFFLAHNPCFISDEVLRDFILPGTGLRVPFFGMLFD